MILELSETSDSPVHFLATVGEVFATFDERTQDSGNVSYGVETEAGRFFVKTAGSPSARANLSHDERVHWLRNAVRLSQALQDPALCQLRNVIESPEGPMLVYEWASGELIGTTRSKREDPASPFSGHSVLLAGSDALSRVGEGPRPSRMPCWSVAPILHAKSSSS